MFKSEIELSHDPKAKKVFVGEVEVSSPELNRAPEYLFHHKERFSGPCDGGIKEKHKHYARTLGPMFNLRYHAAHYHTWISPHLSKDVASMLTWSGKNWRLYNNRLVDMAHNAIEHVEQAERDGLINIIPAVVCFGKSPKGIKSDIGSAAWRQICRNSKTRNAKIMRSVFASGKDDIGENFTFMLDCPSGCIDRVINHDQNSKLAWRVCGEKTGPGFSVAYDMIRDAEFMGVDINPNWSFARIIREHDEAARRVARRDYSDDVFCDPHEVCIDGFEFTKLTTQAAIAEEGAVMRHCVASYAMRSSSNKYDVYSVSGLERATLGLYLGPRGRVEFDQLYGPCNKPTGEACRNAAFSLIGQIESGLRNE